MRTLPPEPSPGDRVSANLVRELIRAIRERTPLPCEGLRLVSGLNGFSYTLPKDRIETETRPWTFGCTEENGNRTGGWYRQIVQIGLTVYNKPTPDAGFTDETECKDGDHYLKIDFNQQDDSEKVKIVRVAPGAGATFQDIPHGILGVFLGTVENGKQTSGIYWPPVIYHYL